MMRGNIAEEIDRCNDAADLDDEHDRVLHHRSRIELDERIDQGTTDDFCIPEGAFTGICHDDLFLSLLEGFSGLQE